jgi:hypothetical protein
MGGGEILVGKFDGRRQLRRRRRRWKDNIKRVFKQWVRGMNWFLSLLRI